MERQSWPPSAPARAPSTDRRRCADSADDATPLAAAPAPAPAAPAPRRLAPRAARPEPRRGHPDPGEPGRPARPRRDQPRGVRGQEGGPARPLCSRSPVATPGRAPAARLPYAGPRYEVPLVPGSARPDRRSSSRSCCSSVPGPRVRPRARRVSARRRDGQDVRPPDAQPDRPLRPARRRPAGARRSSVSPGVRLRLGEADAGQPDEPARAADAARRSSRPPARSRTSSWRPSAALPAALHARNRRARRARSRCIVIQVLDIFVVRSTSSCWSST